VTLLLKLLLAPALVVASSLAGRRWGPPVAGTLVALPIVAGPILLITCLEHGSDFGARAASSALLGLISLALFTLVLAWVSRVLRWQGALVVAWAGCLAADLALSRLTIHPALSLLVVLGWAWTVARLLPADGPAPAPIRWPWWDLPGRAAATVTLVLIVTTLASTVGPQVTGVLAPFPIGISVVSGFALAQHGSVAAIQVLRGIPQGLLGFSLFCFVVATLIQPVGTAAAFAVALAGTLAVQLTWRFAHARSTGPVATSCATIRA
jgi:hypothetical protein